MKYAVLARRERAKFSLLVVSGEWQSQVASRKWW